jgi:chemotaxis protein CheY-P-specific phosphatase CheC
LQFSDDSLKQELLSVVDGVGNQCTSPVVKKMNNKKVVTISKFPPYHYQLNPID